jgi:hypothetical protein
MHIKGPARTRNFSALSYNLSIEEKRNDYRAWLLLFSPLAATITFTAGLTPPDGF